MATQPSSPSADSIVDYLKTGGQDSSFNSRKKMFEDLGYSSRLGDYVGSSSQNLNLLKGLQKKDTPALNTTSALGFNVPKTGGQTTPAQMLQPTVDPMKLPGNAPIQPAPATPAQDASALIGTPSAPAATPPAPTTPFTTTPPVPGGASPAQTQDTDLLNSTGISASSIYPDIFGEGNDESEADLVNRYLQSAEGQIFMDRQKLSTMNKEAKAEVTKKELEAKYQSDREALDQKLAENGLVSSGIRNTQIKALSDSLAASTLNVDREFASALLDADIDLRENILKGVSDLIKAAGEGRKEAIAQLNQVGLAVIGNQLVPNLASRTAERADRASAMAERRLQLAEEAASRAEAGNKLTLSEVTSKGLPASLVGVSEQAVADSFYSKEPPKWFTDKFLSEAPQIYGQPIKAPFSPAEQAAIQKAWDDESINYVAGLKESNDYGKAVKYFKEAYGDAVDAATVQQLANQVELYINGGSSYKEAITKVIEEAS